MTETYRTSRDGQQISSDGLQAFQSKFQLESRRYTQTFTSAEILAADTPIEMVAALAGHAFIITAAYSAFDATATAYATDLDGRIEINDVAMASGDDNIAGTADIGCQFVINNALSAVNTAIDYAHAAAPITGTGVLRVFIEYLIVPVP